MLSAIIAWWAYRQGKAAARRQAYRHLVVVAHALYTGSTGAYSLTPDLPRVEDSTAVDLMREVPQDA